MSSRVALIVGSTGLIGNQLLDLLLREPSYFKVIALSRRSLDISNPKLENVIIQTGEWEKLSELVADDVFCCLGTTIKQAKTKEAFRKVDYEYPLEVAKHLRKNGASQFLLVSSLGANAKSRIFYNQVKGEAEDAISQVGFQSYHIFRPSLLLGNRSEQRSGEDAAKIFYKLFGFIIPKKLKAIDSFKVAKAMLTLALDKKEGRFIYESEELQSF
jgi:uncharacterized protein YbjT (DUF2867 family)